MNWFDTSGLTSLAKTALKEAQKTLDKALDIQDESGEEEEAGAAASDVKSSPGRSESPQKDNTDFFSSWGLTVSAEGPQSVNEQAVVTESPSKASSQSLWGSFAGSFFEHPNNAENDAAIVQPPKAKSMNVINDSKYGSATDLFAKSQLVMSDETEFDVKKAKEEAKAEERRNSSRSNRLSLVSSLNSSDSVEVLSQSLKTTPDSEAASVHSISHSSSTGQKLNSESVEILPDSLVSPSSIECLGFDSYSSDKNSSSSSNLSPGKFSDKKSTPVDRTEKAETADSVSLVADDDDDTMSYNSISECTAPTVLDTDEKSISPFPKRVESKKLIEKEFLLLDPLLLPQKMQVSENSSNDGSWSDRTLNADNDSMVLDVTVEEPKKEPEAEDTLMEKLSDSSSFYNVNVSSEMLKSESSAFVNVEKQQCSQSEKSESLKDSIKERTSPTSSESKSDLVKIGSDRTSGHTSGDEMETTTSSDIEIIPSPNGDGHGFCRNSPAKYNFKQSKFDGTTSPNLVDLVLGKSLATKIRGHNRELSEASIQSNTSDDSQGSENDRLMRRLCEMAEILEARENRLMEVSRSNAELAESNADLKSQMETMLAKHGTHEGGDINTITEDYTQRMDKIAEQSSELDRLKRAIAAKEELEVSQIEARLNTTRSSLEAAKRELAEVEAERVELRARCGAAARDKRDADADREQRDALANQLASLRQEMVQGEGGTGRGAGTAGRAGRQLASLRQEMVQGEGGRDAEREQRDALAGQLASLRQEMVQGEGDGTRSGNSGTRWPTSWLACGRRWCKVREGRDAEREQRTRWPTSWLACGRRWCKVRGGRDAEREQRDALAGQLASLRQEMVQGDGASEGGRDAEREQRDALANQLASLRQEMVQGEGGRDAEREQRDALANQLASLRQEMVQGAPLGGAGGGLAGGASRGPRASGGAGSARGAAGGARERQGRGPPRSWRSWRRCNARRWTGTRRTRTRCGRCSGATRRDGELRAAAARAQHLAGERDALRGHVGELRARVDDYQVSDRAKGRRGAGAAPGRREGRAEGPCGGAEGQGGRLPVTELRAAAARAQHLAGERDALRGHVGELRARVDDYQSLQEQYDALLQMYGEKEEQLEELKLDLQDVTQLYKAQLDELVALKRAPR
ncbi:LOW QUALITY PROTEIN: hypothetical protein MSG28_004899 [Choristoneura fumiferana]|uniref:Uncharacterized protein n=1 Tax=Choristoneura fumiferana TaxID=7141 RepID=A0ACC0JNZ9_CHOFU|nr:LOW QUALITY PROTEIN: hypothetical protein MSG28_004899 [Choristoneura fumiferana]